MKIVFTKEELGKCLEYKGIIPHTYSFNNIKISGDNIHIFCEERKEVIYNEDND